MTSPLFTKISLTVFPFMIILGVSLRFFKITEIGVDGSDVFFYWQTAFEWLQGQETLTEHFRPFIYWLYSKVMAITGPNDWILSAFNAFLDSLVGLLLILLGLILRRDWILGLSAAVSYLFLLHPLQVSRTVLVHTPSTFFITAFIVFFFYWLKKISKLHIFFSGAFLSMAWFTHPDLAVLGAPVTLLMILKLFKSDEVEGKKFWIKLFTHFSFFLLGYFSLFIIFAIPFSTIDLLTNLLQNQSVQGKNLQSTFAWRFLTFTYEYFLGTVGLTGLVLFTLSYAVLVFKTWKRKITSQDLVLFIFPLSYMFFCSLLFSRYLIPRLFLPFAPMIILFIHVQLFDLMKNKVWRTSSMLLLTLIMVGSNFESFSYSMNEPVSIYKQIDQKYSKYLGKEDKLLITPLSEYHIHAPLQKNLYLNKQTLYLPFTNEESLSEVVTKNNISHVWIADILIDPHVFKENLKFSTEERLWTLFKMAPDEYLPQKEKDAIREFLSGINAKLIDKSPFGELYELK